MSSVPADLAVSPSTRRTSAFDYPLPTGLVVIQQDEKVAAQEQGEGAEGAALAPLRHGAASP